MAKIETSGILGSSLDNFLVFSNTSFERPYVRFMIGASSNLTGELTIRDSLDGDGYSKAIKYSPTENITESSFRMVGDQYQDLLSLFECLRKIDLFFDMRIENSSGGVAITALIDSSTRYSIYDNSGRLIISGNYAGYVPREPNKFVLLLQEGDGSQIVLEKYTYGSEVGFNVTSPFEHLSFKHPMTLSMTAYRVDDNNIVAEYIANNRVIVLPTTLSKFSDVELTDYLYRFSGLKVDFLTNLKTRSYNYGERTALSVLSEKPIYGLSKRYYTVSGRYLGAESSILYTETVSNRTDFYFTLALDDIELSTGRQVGYVLVAAIGADGEVTNPIRYDVEAKCNQNNEIFFINELGGVDSFNFLGERVFESKISDMTTHFTNPVRPWGRTRVIEMVTQKKDDEKHILKTVILDSSTAKWLSELGRSKYAFVMRDSGYSLFEMVIVDDLDVTVSDRENSFEVEMEYRMSDKGLSN